MKATVLNKHGVSPIMGFHDQDSDADEKNEEEQVEEKEPGEKEVEFGEEGIEEEEETIEPNVVCKPCRPSIAEVEAHNATHIPLRTWCEICVRGRAQDMGHKVREKEAMGIPKVIIDYGYTR